MKGNVIPVLIFTLVASLLPEIMVREFLGGIQYWVPFTQIAILSWASLYLHYINKNQLSKYTTILTAVVVFQFFTGFIQKTTWWRQIFAVDTFAGNFGGSVLLKLISVLPVIALLIYLYRSHDEVYLAKGDLSVRAERMGWLGIEGNRITWGRLAVISAILISMGTLLLTILTVTGLSAPDNLRDLPVQFPLVVLLALVNSFSEGIVYRSAVLGPLRKVLSKEQVIFIAALFFGIGHYYGAPSGLLGVSMSVLLGWYLCRSLYETKGFASAWMIHFMQDVVIFSTIIVLM